MDEKIETQSVIATLRSDTPLPVLQLWDAHVDDNVVPEYADYTEEMNLNVSLRAEMGSSQTSVRLEVEDLVTLIQNLRPLIELRAPRSDWWIYSRRLEFHFHVQSHKMGPPVACEIWLRDAISVQEEHHCCFETNLTWIALFLADLERLACHYASARRLLA